MTRFKVLVGRHAEGGEVYSAGDVVDSATDLNLMNSPGSVKFEQLHGDEPIEEAIVADVAETAESKPDAYNTMSVSELREYAAEEEIDLEGIRLKADIIEAIRSAQ